MPELSVVIPVYNEAAFVEPAARELCAALDQRHLDYEVLLCENGSKDATPEAISRIEAAHPRVRHLKIGEPNYGKAMRAGILAAEGTFVVCDEIDLCFVEQFYDHALPMLRAVGGPDMVVGSKAMRDAHDDRPPLRRAATLILNGLLRIVLGFRGTDTHGVKAFRRARLLPVAMACVVDRDLFASEFVIRASRMDRRVEEIPLSLHEKRPPSIHLFKRVPRVLKSLVKLFWVIRIRHR